MQLQPQPTSHIQSIHKPSDVRYYMTFIQSNGKLLGLQRKMVDRLPHSSSGIYPWKAAGWSSGRGQLASQHASQNLIDVLMSDQYSFL